MSIRDVSGYLRKNQIMCALVLFITGWIIIVLRYILILLFVSFILFTAILPAVTFFRKKLPYLLAIFLTYFVLFILFGLVIAAVIPFFISQLQQFIINFPHFFSQIQHTFHFSIDSSRITNLVSSQAVTIGKNTIAITSNVVGIIFSIITVTVLSFYLLYDYDSIKKGLLSLFRASGRSKTGEVMLQIEGKLGSWVRGQLFLCFIIGIATYVGYTIIQIPFAVPLATLAGILEIIPTIGPFLGVIPAMLIALTISPIKLLLVLIVYIIIQIVESNFLVPKVMQRATSLHPIIIICAIIIGNDLLGIIGALVAVPFVSFLKIVLAAALREDY